MSDAFPMVPIGRVLSKSEEWMDLDPTVRYRRVTVRLWGKGVVQRDEVSGSEIASARQLAVHANQFILSRIDARNGAFGLVPDSLDCAVVSNDFPVFAADESQIAPAFLNLLSKTPYFVELCKAASEGTTNRVRLKEERFLSMPIPLPPLPEQQRIVARIDELAAKIEEACRLRCVAMAEAEALLVAATARAFDRVNWPVYTIEDLVGRENLRNGKSVKPGNGPSPVQCLTLAALRNGQIDCRRAKSVPMTEAEAKPYFLHEGDVFVVRGNGSKELVGRAGVVQGSCSGIIFPDLFIRVPLDPTVLLSPYFVAVWNSRRMRDLIEDRAKTTSGIWKINQGHIASFSIPVPPVPEQRRVVAYLDDLRKRMDALRHLQEETAAELDAMLPSVLDRAFKGEL